MELNEKREDPKTEDEKEKVEGSSAEPSNRAELLDDLPVQLKRASEETRKRRSERK